MNICYECGRESPIGRELEHFDGCPLHENNRCRATTPKNRWPSHAPDILGQATTPKQEGSGSPEVKS